MRLVKTVCCAAATVLLLAPGARADEWNKKTILTFSGPVQIPGATLAAGTYVFKLADLEGNRHVVQVLDKDEKHVYGMLLAIPDQRLEPTADPVVLFSERAAGSPQAIRAWFYPGETIGNEFVYPKDQAMKIAKETHQSVLSMDDRATSSTTDDERIVSMRGATVARIDESGAIANESRTARAVGTTGSETVATTEQSPAAAQNRPATTTASAPTTTAEAPVATTTPSDDARLKNSSRNSTAAVGTSGQAEAPAPKRLPRTAGSLAALELLSGIALAAGYGLRRLRAGLGGARQ
jgi:hypothetical protein